MNDSTTTIAQTALTSHDGRAIVEPARDDDRRIRCPDCDQDVTATKGSHAAPEDCPADKIWGWQCRTCENTLPSNAVAADAPTFTDRITGLEVEFRDGHERVVPAPAAHVEEVDA
jgi:hypothetical protein